MPTTWELYEGENLVDTFDSKAAAQTKAEERAQRIHGVSLQWKSHLGGTITGDAPDAPTYRLKQRKAEA